MNRSTTDLIDELKRESEAAYVASIIVGFPAETKYVTSQDPEPLKTLNALCQEGGEPVGILRMVQEDKKTMSMSLRPLEEYRDDEHIKNYLEQLGRESAGWAELKFGVPKIE